MGKKQITLDDFEQRVLLRILSDERNRRIEQTVPTDDVLDLMRKVLEAPELKPRWRTVGTR